MGTTFNDNQVESTQFQTFNGSVETSINAKAMTISELPDSSVIKHKCFKKLVRLVLHFILDIRQNVK